MEKCLGVCDQFIAKNEYEYEKGYIEKIKILKEMKRSDEVVLVYDKYINKCYHNIELYLDYAQFLKDERKFEKLAVFCNEFFRDYDRDNENFTLIKDFIDFSFYGYIQDCKGKVIILKEKEKVEDCLDIWDKFISIFPDEFDGYKEKIDLLKQFKKYDPSFHSSAHIPLIPL